MFCGSSSRCHRLIVLFPDHTHLLLEAMTMEIVGSIAPFGMYCICLTNEHSSNRYEACNRIFHLIAHTSKDRPEPNN